ncbi:MAG: cell envelope integrity protein TolA [Gammaproteobacteria bacterium]|nr:cell envelope integrity protein TolA [Gammaproteobacteria bacterium]
MNNVFNNLVIYNGYPISIAAAVAFHVMILVLLVWVQSNNRMDSFELVQPTIVKALFIDENPQVRNQQILERQRVERIEQQRILREEEQFREQEEVERQQRQVQEQREREQTVLRDQEELERQRAQEAQQERERQERTRVEQQRELVEAERLRQEEEVERQRQAEEVAVIAAEAARTEFELVQSATALIQQALQQVWNRPPSARNGMRAILRIRMLPTGELIEASITQSSGDSAFDRSAENAVYSASPFAELQNLPINVFNTNFRTLTLIFEPEDLLN